MTLFHKNKNICIINKFENEPNEHFLDRCNFITSQQIKNDTDYNKIITFSRIYVNNKYLGCMYDAQTMYQLKAMVNNAYM